MEDLKAELAEQNIASVFIYTHEAHPGKNYPHHTTFEQKMAHAQAFKEYFNISRPILVDSLDGACHFAYGGMPNMSWIMDRGGRAVYKADWTDVHSIRTALRDLQAAVERRRSDRITMAPFRVERLEYRPRDGAAFNAGLERNGPNALAEYEEQMRRWKAKGER